MPPLAGRHPRTTRPAVTGEPAWPATVPGARGLRASVEGLVGPGRRAAWRRFVLRRMVAAVLAATAVLGVLGTVREQAAPRSVPVVVARTDLAAGQRIAAGDVAIARWPAALAAGGMVSESDSVVGQVLAAPVGVGEALTPSRLIGPGLLAGQPPGSVAAVVPLSDPVARLLARPGTHVDVVAGSGEVVARGAVVLAAPGPSPGVWSGGDDQPGSVVVALDAGAAPALARGGPADGGIGGGFSLVAHHD